MKDQAKQSQLLTQVEIAKRLGMSERNLREVLANLGIDHKTTAFDQIAIAYIRDLREKAAGRGGDDQASLTQARTEESLVKAARTRIEYHRELRTIIDTEEAADLLNEWSRTSNREYTQGTHQLVAEIQSAHNITVDTELVDNIARATVSRIQEHAEKLGRTLVESIDPIFDPENSANG